MEKLTGRMVGQAISTQELGSTTENLIASLGWEDAVRSEKLGDELAITCIDVEPERDMTFRAEGPESFAIFLCLSGRGTVQIDGGEPYDVKPGQAILFSADRYTRGWNRMFGGERLLLIDIRYERSFLRTAGGRQLEHFSAPLLNDHCVPERGAYMVGFAMTPELSRCAADISTCSMENGVSRELYLRAKALEVLAHVVEYSDREVHGSVAFTAQEIRRLEEARDVLDQRFEEAWTIPALAREVGLNEKKLKSGFRQFVGNTIRQYLQEIRIEAAASMLRKGQSVTEVAYATGFTSLSHFAKVFKERMGLSPREFARNAR